MRHEEQDPAEKPVVRDRRRIDPVTGAVREPQQPAASAAAMGAAGQSAAGTSVLGPADSSAPGAAGDKDARIAELEAALAERTGDVQRLQAEYVNYKRRVDRDRAVVRETSLAAVLSSLLPVLDDIGRAREHGELDGGFKAVAESLERTLEGLGLQQFGKPGDPFDPRVHEALMHGHSDSVAGPTCDMVLQAGYRLGERVIRPARVAVVEPAAQPLAEPAVEVDAPVESFDPADSSVPGDAELRTASEQA